MTCFAIHGLVVFPDDWRKSDEESWNSLHYSFDVAKPRVQSSSKVDWSWKSFLSISVYRYILLGFGLNYFYLIFFDTDTSILLWTISRKLSRASIFVKDVSASATLFPLSLSKYSLIHASRSIPSIHIIQMYVSEKNLLDCFC